MVNGNPARKENHFRGIVVAHRSVNYLSTQEPVCEPFVLYSEIIQSEPSQDYCEVFRL